MTRLILALIVAMWTAGLVPTVRHAPMAGVSAVPTTVAVTSPPAECREWALGCRRYPALTTAGTAETPTPPSADLPPGWRGGFSRRAVVRFAPSAAAQPVRTAHHRRGSSMTGNSQAPLVGAIRGIASWVPARYGARYLALPEGAGVRVRLCGAARCVVMTSNDAGPDLAMQRKGRIVDLSAALFKRITGLPLSHGLAWVTVTR